VDYWTDTMAKCKWIKFPSFVAIEKEENKEKESKAKRRKKVEKL
jgi:hypothetical protein